MRRIAKLSLLLAPLMLASISGCATPGWMSSSEPTDPREARVNRLLAVAQEYEMEGKTDAAMRVYEHVIAQQPEHAVAIQRRDLLAQQGVKSGGRNLKPQIGVPATQQELLAKAEKIKADRRKEELKDSADEIHRKNAEIAEVLARKKAQAQPLVALPADKAAVDGGATPTPIPEKSLVASTRVDLDQVLSEKAPVVDPGWAPKSTDGGWTVVENAKTPAVPADDFKPVIAATELKTTTAEWKQTETSPPVQAAATETSDTAEVDDSGWTVAEAPKAMAETVGLSEVKEEKKEPEGWGTTDLSRVVAETPVPSPEADKWAPTRLAALCDQLTPELTELVERLESPEATERVAALLELGEMRTEARPASVAVYSLMEDKDAVVAVYAAGTLRQVTGDAWSSVHTLTRYLKDQDDGIVQLAAYLLGQMGPEAMDAVPELERLRNEACNLTSLHAAEALTHIAPGDHSSVKKLTSALSDEDRQLRWFAAVSLGSIAGDCEELAAQALKKALQDGEEEVRVAACLSLGGLGSHASIAIPELEAAAQSESADVKSAAETALACLRG